MEAVLYFSTSETHLGSWRNRQFARIVRVGSRSRIAHVAIGFDGVVLNHAADGVRYMLGKDFLRTSQTICATVTVPIRNPIDLDKFKHLFGVPIRPILSFLRWLRFGRGPWVPDCLCTVLSLLQDGGVDVPRTLATPAALYKHLRRR